MTESFPASAPSPHTPEAFDRKQAFLLYANFCGDVEKTGHALNVSPLEVLRIADEEEWGGKLASIIKLKKSGKPGDVERGINRALNFVQAHRMRNFLERMINHLEAMTDDELMRYCVQDAESTDKAGNVKRSRKIVTRPFADLAAALEKVHAVTYLALSDTATDRGARKEQNVSEETTSQEIHSAISEAMSKARANTPRGMLFDAQLATAQATAPAAVAPLPPKGPNARKSSPIP